MISALTTVRLSALPVLLVLCAAGWSASRAETVPSPEQVLAAGIHAGDVTAMRLPPGGWWDDGPEFNGRLDNPETELVFFVVKHVVGKPDDDPAAVDTALSLFSDAAASAAAFKARADDDKQRYGELAPGPKVGDQSRYMRQAASGSEKASSSLRFRFGRYLARIDVSGKAAPVPDATLAKLAKTVVARLTRLEAGKLPAPALPELAKALPEADGEIGPVMGSASGPSDWWSWVWRTDGARLVVSAKLRALLHAGVGKAEPVVRIYGLRAQPDNLVAVTIMPFSRDALASQYLKEDHKEDPKRSMAADDDTEIVVRQLDPEVGKTYYATFRRGRYIAEVDCFAPYADTAPACEGAVRAMAERVAKRVPPR